MGSPAPTVQQWQRLWQLWDAAVLVMVPPKHHCDRPLELRQPFIFYIGHLPAFTDARLTRVLQQQQLTQPAHYADMFARGIDPDLDDPTQCHSHSPTPAQWPPLRDILAYRDRVRARILQLYSSSSSGGGGSSNGHAAAAGDAAARCSCDSSRQQQQGTCTHSKANSCCCCAVQSPLEEAAVIAAMAADVQHVLWMSYEHEAMHLETLMYLLVQYEAVQPPPAEMLAAAAVPEAAWRSDLAAAAAGVATHDNALPLNASSNGGCTDGHSAGCAGLTAASKLDSTVGQLLPQPPTAAWVEVPSASVSLGFEPNASSSSSSSSSSANNSSGGSREKPLLFGWDNECPARQVSVAGFKIQHRPVTVLEYLQFLACKMAGSCTAAAELQGVNGSCRSLARSMVVNAAPAGAEDESNMGSETPFTNQYGNSAQQGGSTESSMLLPQLLANLQDRQQSACTGCQQAVCRLLRQKAVQALLPASLAVLQQRDQRLHSNGGSTAGNASGKIPASVGCFGLCYCLEPTRHKVLHSTRSSTGNSQQTADLQALQDAAHDALQQYMGVKTVFGLAPISIAGYWPVYCSAVQAEQYAAWASTPAQTYRLPTEPEILAARQYNSRLLDSLNRDPDSEQLISTAAGTGVDFAAWHPVCVQLLPNMQGIPVSAPKAPAQGLQGASSSCGSDNVSTLAASATACTTAGTTAAGSPAGSCVVSQLCDNGWEWTCSVFDRHEGFQAHPMYPEYSQDFFGGKHVVLLGGSWATLNSIAGRQSFRNWYQKGQQHVFAKFRLVQG